MSALVAAVRAWADTTSRLFDGVTPCVGSVWVFEDERRAFVVVCTVSREASVLVQAYGLPRVDAQVFVEVTTRHNVNAEPRVGGEVLTRVWPL